MTDINNNFQCPICQETMMIPRLYPCGHNICEECMIKNDQSQNSSNPSMFQLPIYKCPICRNETIKEWWARPINNALIDVLCQLSDDYKSKHLNHQRVPETEYTEVVIPPNINLAYMCNKMRQYKANELYKQILPILYKASVEGKPFVTISSEHANISNIAEILADKLIKKNGIYRLTATQRECQIELVPTSSNYQYCFDNNNYNTSIPILNSDNSLNTTNSNTTSDLNTMESNTTSNLNTMESNTTSDLNTMESNTTSDPNNESNDSDELITHVVDEQTINIFQPFLNNTQNSTNSSQVDGVNVEPEQFSNTNLEVVENETNNQVRNGIISVSVQNSGPSFNERASRDISQFVVQNILRNLNNLSSTSRN